MAKSVRIPIQLRKLTDGQDVVEVEASTIREMVNELETRFPGCKSRLTDEKGEMRRFINVFVNEEDIRFIQMRDTPLNDGDEVSIVPAVAGG